MFESLLIHPLKPYRQKYICRTVNEIKRYKQKICADLQCFVKIQNKRAECKSRTYKIVLFPSPSIATSEEAKREGVALESQPFSFHIVQNNGIYNQVNQRT